jgi:hypothetical protein
LNYKRSIIKTVPYLLALTAIAFAMLFTFGSKALEYLENSDPDIEERELLLDYIDRNDNKYI